MTSTPRTDEMLTTLPRAHTLHATGARGGLRRRSARRAAARRRRGNALVEFAVIAFAFYLLLAGTVELGRMIFASQVLQSAARVGARELAVTPLPATATFAEALAHPDVRANVYDPTKLALPVDGLTDAEVRALIDGLPIVNRALAPLFQHDHDTPGYPDLLRYPGAVFETPDGLRVLIPRVVERSDEGHETIEWVDVVEEAVPDASDPASSPFSLVSTGPQRGLVALRIHYPFQAAMLSAFRQDVDAAGNPRNDPVLADDASVTEAAPSGHGAPATRSGRGAYAGTYALGAQEALGGRVRPFRRLLTNQSFFRREVFSE